MKKLVPVILKALDWVESVSAFLSMGIMIVSIFLQVVFRYILKAPLTWSEELARYAMVYIVFVGVSYGTKTNSHLGVEIVTNLLPLTAKRAVTILAQSVTLIIYSVVFCFAFLCTKNIYATGQLSACMRIPMWLAYAALPIGFGSAILRQIEVMFLTLKHDKVLNAEGGEAL